VDRLTRKYVPLAAIEFYTFKVPMELDEDAGLQMVDVDMVLPHELWSLLYSCHPNAFEEMFGFQHATEFWDHIPAARRPAPQDDLHNIVPLRVFGDDVPVGQTSSMDVLLWCSACSVGLPALLSRLPAMCLPMKHAVPVTFQAIYEVVTWSMRCIEEGCWPSTDHSGKAWCDRDSLRYHRGQRHDRLSGKRRGIFFECTGDWKWLVSAFQLPQKWSTPDLCHRCFAMLSGLLAFTEFGDDAAHRVRGERSTEAYFDFFRSQGLPVPALAETRMFHIVDFILLGWMHATALGISQVAAGNALVILSSHSRFGEARGKFQLKLSIQLKNAYRLFKTWASENKREHSQAKFTVAMMSMLDGNMSWPLMKGKAHNITVVVSWLAWFLRTLPSPSEDEFKMSALFWSLAECDWLFRDASTWLSAGQCTSVEAARKVLFENWSLLSSAAARAAFPRWQFLPKHHMVDHILRSAVKTKRNPASHWEYLDEHHMGLSKKACGRFFHKRMGRRVLFAQVTRLGIAVDRRDQWI